MNEEGQEQQLKIPLYSISADITEKNEDKNIASSFCGKVGQKFCEHSGIWYLLATSIVASCCTFSLKLIPADTFDLMIARFALQSTFFGVYATVYKGYNVFDMNGQPLACALNAFMSSLTNLLYFAAFYFLPLSDLNTIKHTNIVWAAILAVIFLKDRFKLVNAITIILTFIGLILATKPDVFIKTLSRIFDQPSTPIISNTTISSTTIATATTSPYYYLGILLASTSAITKSVQLIARKHLVKTKLPHSIMNFHFTIIALLVSIIYSIIRRFWFPEPYPWKLMGTFGLLIGCFQLFTNILLPKGLKRESVQVITILSSFDIIYAVILQYVFFRQTKSWIFFTGALLIVSAAVVLSIDRHLESKRKQKNQPLKIICPKA